MSRPIIENLHGIAAHELHISSLNRGKTYRMDNVSLRWPWLTAIRLSCEAAEFHQPSLYRATPGIVQQFGLKPQKTGFGIRY